MTAIIESPRGVALDGLPPLDCDVDDGDIRIMVLPPGRLDAEIRMRRNLIDVNLNGVEHALSVNSDRRVRHFIEPDSISLWPTDFVVGIATENYLPGCVVEISDRKLDRWREDSGPAIDCSSAFAPYGVDVVAAELGRVAIRELVRSARIGAPIDRLTMETLALGLASRMIARLSAKDGDIAREMSGWTRRSDISRLRRAIELAECRLVDPALSVSDMADAAGFSAPHFAVIFKAGLGETPYAYILRRRSEIARDLIQGTRLPLAEIAYGAGFSSQAHMTTALRRRFGCTPGVMRGA